MSLSVIKIVSGGQTGADRAALDWAIQHGVAHGGWCPLGRLAEDGVIPKRYELEETPLPDYAQRTEWNVRDADGTVILSVSRELTGGSLLTAQLAATWGKPWLHLSRQETTKEAATKLVGFVEQHRIRVLNVAGPRASLQPTAGAFVHEVLDQAFGRRRAGVADNPGMKVLLVNTNRMKPAVAPIGLDYLADSLMAAGHTPKLLDLCFAEDVASEVANAVRDFVPDVIGVTIRNTDDCYFSSQAFFLSEVREVIGLLRGASPAPIVLGGVGFSVAPMGALEYCGADYGVVGEGEQALVALLHAIQGGVALQAVPNLLYRDGGTIWRNPSVVADPARLPPRRRGFVDNPRYFREGGQAGFETKRGCPMGCIYCADPVAKGRCVRPMPPQRVVDELTSLLNQGIDHFHTCDCEFNLPRDHAAAVCRSLIDAGLGERIRWYAYCAPLPFDDELAGLFKRAGCAGIDFGADSGCDDILRRLGRSFTTDDLRRTAAIMRKHGLPFMFDLLIGGPGETRETVRETIDFVREVAPHCVGLSIGVRIYQGTPLAELVRDSGSGSGLHGATQDNPDFLKPVFYISPQLGDAIVAYVRELVAGDERFFLPAPADGQEGYNYNDNTILVQAIRDGARGAYWDILRRRRPQV